MRRLSTTTVMLLPLFALVLAGCAPGRSSPLPPTSSGSTPPEHSPGGITPSSPIGIRFHDATAESGVAFVHCSGNSPTKEYPTAFGSGVAMLDFDRDGWIDLYLATTRDLPLDAPSRAGGNRLYRNRGDGTFDDVTSRAGTGFRGFSHGVAVGDVDNNGYPDLYLCNFGPNVLYLNRGDGTFRDATAGSGVDCPSWSTGAAMLDYDGDGHLDLYVANYGKWPAADHPPFCGDESAGVRTYCSPHVIDPESHFLFRNRGDATFEDVTHTAGVYRPDGRGLGVVAVDVNRDGSTDLFVANDLCPNFLFLNNGDGTFRDATMTSGTAASATGKFQAGMGVDAEDATGDGFPELFVTTYAAEADTLYRNLGGETFLDDSLAAGIVDGSLAEVGWGCSLADFDNDGWPDLLVVNGHVDDNLHAMRVNSPYSQLAKVWRNRGEGRFRLVADAGPFFRARHVARGAAFGDLDNDGDCDVVVSLMDHRPAILRNESAQGNWIRLELVGVRSNRSAIGAAVEVVAGGRTIHRQVKGGGSYLSANDPRILVGVGGAERVERVKVRWPSGHQTILNAPETRVTHVVSESALPGGLPSPRPGPTSYAR